MGEAGNEDVEGHFGRYTIRLVNFEQDISNILTFLTENFHYEEPMGKLCRPDPGFVADVNSKIALLMEGNSHLCLIALDTTTGDIAAVQLQFEWTKEQALESENAPKSTSPFFQRQFMTSLYAPLNEARFSMFAKYSVDRIIWNFVAATSKQHRNQGLASELFRRMVVLMRKLNYSVVFSYYSSPFSRKCAAKVGLVELAKSKFSEAVNEETGEPFLPKATYQEDFTSLMALHIK